MWIYLKNNWLLFILKMPGSRGSPCVNLDFVLWSLTAILRGWKDKMSKIVTEELSEIDNVS